MHAAAKNSVSPHKNTAEEGREGGIPPADLPAEVSTQAGPREFRSDIFKQTPKIKSGMIHLFPYGN
jgi:hypothetical protein